MKKINQRTQLKKTIAYLLRKNKTQIPLFAFGLFISIAIAWYKKDFFDNSIDPIAGIMTLLVATSIAIMNYSKDWRDSLPKTLTVHYLYKEKYYLSCYYADLTSEGDIRMWAQQIGKQMANGLLHFNPFFDLKEPEIISLQPSNAPTLHYEIRIRLKSPEYIQGSKKEKLHSHEYKRWYVVHDKDHEKNKKLELKIIEPPDKEIPLPYTQALKEAINTTEDADQPKV